MLKRIIEVQLRAGGMNLYSAAGGSNASYQGTGRNILVLPVKDGPVLPSNIVPDIIMKKC